MRVREKAPRGARLDAARRSGRLARMLLFVEAANPAGGRRNNGMTANRETIVIDRERCTGCGACIEICPVGGLGFDDRPNSRGAHPVRFLGAACRADGLCAGACPEPGVIDLVAAAAVSA